MNDDRRVAITGIGLLTALGNSRDDVWQAMVTGRCGIGNAQLIDGTGYRSQQVAEIREYGRDRDFSPRAWGRLSRADQTAILAAREALDDAGGVGSVTPDRIGVVLGSGTANLIRNEEWFADYERVGWRNAAAAKIFNHFPSTPTDLIAAHFGFEGIKASVLSACSSSTVAIGYAADAIRSGIADVVLAGASDTLCRITFSGFNALRLVDEEPCRPFCRTRKGMNIGEAAAVLVVESMAAARRRGARMYAEVLGYGA